MPHMLELGPRSVGVDFEPKTMCGEDVALKLRAWTPLTEVERQQLPRKVYVDRSNGKRMPDVMGKAFSPFLISLKFRRLFEELMPGQCDFFPMRVMSENNILINGKVDHGEYYLLWGVEEIDCISIELTHFSGGYGRAGYENTEAMPGLSLWDDEPCTLLKSSIGDRYFWRGKGEYVQYFFCSDEFRKKMKEKKIVGFSVARKCGIV